VSVTTVPAPVWVQVVAAAEGRCECTQTGCHTKQQARCPQQGQAGRALVAAPRDTTIPGYAAWRVPVGELAAWCPACLQVAGSRARRARAESQPTTEVLFMNRDGYRGDRVTAEHEAAHAVVAVLSGLVVGPVTIAPSKADRARYAGMTWMGLPCQPWPIAQAPTAVIDAAAAGYAWELEADCDRIHRAFRVSSWARGRAWLHAAADRMPYRENDFHAAARRVRRVLRRPPVHAAVRQVADLLQERRSGTIHGTTVEQLCTRLGAIPTRHQGGWS
jgi:hypothetical protein